MARFALSTRSEERFKLAKLVVQINSKVHCNNLASLEISEILCFTNNLVEKYPDPKIILNFPQWVMTKTEEKVCLELFECPNHVIVLNKIEKRSFSG